MTAPSGQPFTVRVNRSVVEVPAGSDTPVTRPDGPTEGSIAVSGGGGGYLSNEIAYWATLLRELHTPGLPVGHVHTPVLVMGPTTPARSPTRRSSATAPTSWRSWR